MRDKLKPYILPISLAIVVIISLLLSLTLLIDPVRFGSHSSQSKSTDLKSNSIYKSRSSIYSPVEVIQNSGRRRGAFLNSETTNLTSTLDEQIRGYQVKSVKSISQNNKKQYFQTLAQRNSLLMDYGGQIPIEFMSPSFSRVKDSQKKIMINRMLVPLNDGSHLYLLNDNNYEVYEVTVKPHTVNKLIKVVKGNVQRIPVQIRQINKKPFIYFPNPVRMKNFGYLMEEQSQTNYINRIIGSSSDTRVSHSKKSTTYSGQDKVLTFDKNDNVKYSNYKSYHPKSYEGVLNGAYKTAIELGLPLENLSFDNYNPQKGTVSYRSFLQGFPVFSKERMGSATYELGNGSTTHYEFSTMSFQVPIPSNKETTTLPDSGTVLSELRAKGMDTKKISVLNLGYQVVPDKKNKLLVSMQPAWFVKYDGSWVSCQYYGSKSGKGVSHEF